MLSDDVLAALAEQHAELAGVVAGLAEADWERPTRCPGWTVADVVLHLAQTDELARASLQDRFTETMARLTRGAPAAANVDEGAAALVDVERKAGLSGEAIGQRWRAGADELRQLLATADGHRRVDWVVGQLSARTLATTRLAEAWIHTGDVADALGADLVPAERLHHVARLAWRTLPYAFARAGRQLSGAVAFELEGPSGHAWTFRPDADPVTVIRGDGPELCLVAGQRLDPATTSLGGDGPDVESVLALVRTYA